MYWRAGDRQRPRCSDDEIDAGIAEGRQAAGALLRGPDDDSQPFDQRSQGVFHKQDDTDHV